MMYRDDQTLGEYQAEITETLRALTARLRVAEARVENSEADLRIKNQKELDELSWRLKDIETRLDDLSSADESEWEARQLEINTAIDLLGRDIENAITLLGG